MIPVYLEQLNEIMSCNCGIPGCNNKAEWIHSKCHIHGGVLTVTNEERTDLYCFVCYKPIISLYHSKITFEKNITADTKYTHPKDLSPLICKRPNCSDNTGHNIKFENNRLVINCNTCKKFIVYIYISEKIKENHKYV